jgi:hypothetical protein
MPILSPHLLVISTVYVRNTVLNIEDATEQFLNHTRFLFPIFFYLSYHTTYSRTQTGATVPLG